MVRRRISGPDPVKMWNFSEACNNSAHFLCWPAVCCCVFAFKPSPAVAAPAPAATVKFEGLTKTGRMKVKWTQLGLVFFLVLSLVMTGCFFWQYQLPKLLPGETSKHHWQHEVLSKWFFELLLLLLVGEKCLEAEQPSCQPVMLSLYNEPLRFYIIDQSRFKVYLFIILQNQGCDKIPKQNKLFIESSVGGELRSLTINQSIKQYAFKAWEISQRRPSSTMTSTQNINKEKG